jgi:hypothetical protein
VASCASAESMYVSLSSVTQWGLGERCGLMDSRSMGMLYCIIAVSTAGLARAMQISALKMDQRLMGVTAAEASA